MNLGNVFSNLIKIFSIDLLRKGDPSTPPRPNERPKKFKGEEGEIRVRFSTTKRQKSRVVV